ncbi:MAG: EamA family transporter [Erysipelotrichaceae bacterium]|nr:EamA family transporter [Erysipelotrichaceae bacterium]
MDKRKGLLLVLLGAIAFSLGGVFIKFIPWNPIAINGGRCIFSSMVIAAYLYFSGHKVKINKTVLLGALCVGSMMLCYVASIKLTSAANAIVLEYTAPIFVIILEAFIFHREIRKIDIIICQLVFLGIGIVMIDGLGKGHVAGDLIALASGVFYALTIMLNEFENGDSLSSVLLGHILMAIIGIPFIFEETDFSASTLLLVAALGIFQAGAGYTLLSVGLKYADPISASLIASIEPVLNPVLVSLFYHEHMGINTIIGGLIVIVSIVVYNVITLKKEKK